MLIPILTLFASFVVATVLGLAGAYLAGPLGAVTGMGLGIAMTFLWIARWAGR